MVGIALLKIILCHPNMHLSLFIEGGVDSYVTYSVFGLAHSVHGTLAFSSAIKSTCSINFCFTSDVVVVCITNAGHIWHRAVAYLHGILVN